MNRSEQIRQAREAKGLSQEALAEQLGLSRQAVSKWEQGASSPSPENLEALGEILEVEFSETPPPSSPLPKQRHWLWWAVGAVLLLAGLLLGMVLTLSKPADPIVTSIRFYDETGVPLHPNLGDGWYAFETPERGSVPVTMVVAFRNGRKTDVNAVSVFFTPSGTETFDQRDQWRVQAVEDGLDYALFVLGLRRDLMGELEICLECSGGARETWNLNLTTMLP